MNTESTQQLKTQLRAQTRQQRQHLSDTDADHFDKQLAAQFSQHDSLKTLKNIALYLSQDNEIGTEHLCQLLFKINRNLYLPKLFTNGHKQLNFCQYLQTSKMVNNRYGIAEPEKNNFIDVADLDLILMPLTAFDAAGNRLGMGGGYYDRTLGANNHSNTLIVGLAYDFQEVKSCPVEPFDQQIQMVLTPTQLIDFR